MRLEVGSALCCAGTSSFCCLWPLQSHDDKIPSYEKKTHHTGGVRITERAECCPLEPGGAAPENTHFHICDLDFSAFKLQERLNKAGEPPEDAEQRVGVWMTAAKARRAKNRACGGAVDVHKIVARSLQKVVMQPTESFSPVFAGPTVGLHPSLLCCFCL